MKRLSLILSALAVLGADGHYEWLATKLFFLFLFVFICFFSGRFAVSTHINSNVTMSFPSAQHAKLQLLGQKDNVLFVLYMIYNCY